MTLLDQLVLDLAQSRQLAHYVNVAFAMARAIQSTRDASV